MLTPDDLLRGPRGRRALLAFAVAGEDTRQTEGERSRLIEAVFDASYRLAEDDGQAITWFGWGEPTPRPESTPADVAEALAGVRLAAPTQDALVEALRASVEAAMYWQGPDGDDLLCARPEVRQALARVAEHLVDSPIVQAWDAPLDRADQWRVVWDGPSTPRPDLTAWRAAVLDEDADAERERPADASAPWSGVWWSIPPHGLATSTGSLGETGPVGMWLVEDFSGARTVETQRLAIDPGARVYEVGDAEDWARLCREFPLVVTASKRHDWFRVTGLAGPWVMPDWSRVAEHHDGVRLSIAGYLRSATTAIATEAEAASVIAGWNPDTTWWLNDVAHPVGDTIRWRFSPSGERWRRF